MATIPALLDRSLRRIWSSGTRRTGVMAAVAIASGLLAALVMPRGPVTTRQVLLLVALALLAGLGGGLASGSRWAMLLVPPIHVLAFEVARIREAGPTVDAIRWSTGFGGLDLIMGRGFHLFLFLLPMILGVSLGAAIARNSRGQASTNSTLRRAIGWLSTALVLATVISLLTPARVPALVDRQGHPIRGAVTELLPIEIGGAEQWIEIRAANEGLPVLLYLPPIPGMGTLPASRELLEPLTTSFVVVTWDMRGSGKSYPAFDPETLTVDRLVADIVELTNYLRDRFDEEKIYLVAEWWGTLFSVLAAQQHPELYYAVVNSDQMVATATWDMLMYDNLLAWATEWEPDESTARDLIALGPPPYDDFRTYQQLTMDFSSDLAGARFLASDANVPPGRYWYPGNEWFGWESYGLDGPEYTLIDRINALRSRSDVHAALYPQLREIDLREDVPSLDVPVYMLDAVQSYAPNVIFPRPLPGTLDLSLEWFDALDAPAKLWGPGLLVEEPDNLLRFMERFVLPETYPGKSP